MLLNFRYNFWFMAIYRRQNPALSYMEMKIRRKKKVTIYKILTKEKKDKKNL